MTFENYKSAILNHYKFARLGVNYDYLIHPSPARLKELCLLLHQRGLTPADNVAFSRFFGEGEADLYKAIQRFDTEKMKPLQRFLLGKSDLQKVEAANVVAVILGFEPRPYQKFRTTEKIADPNENLIEDVEDELHREAVQQKQRPGSMVRMAVPAAAAIILVLMMWRIFAGDTDCMLWRNDHYEEVRCDIILKPGETLEPTDREKLALMKRIEVCDTVTFFKNKTAIIWYDKFNGKVDFFTYPGLHPETGRTLKPVTTHIVRTYVRKCGEN